MRAATTTRKRQLHTHTQCDRQSDTKVSAVAVVKSFE